MANYNMVGRTALCWSKENNVWTWVDVYSKRTSDLLFMYREIEVPAKDLYNAEVTIKLSPYYSLLMGFNGTLREWLTHIGNKVLGTTPGLPKLTERSATYVNAARVLSTQMLAGNDAHPSNKYPLADLVDVVVTHKTRSHKDLRDYVLWSIDGYFVPSGLEGYGCRLKGAGRVAVHSREITLGGLSFEGISKIQTVPITSQTLNKILPTARWDEMVTINTVVPVIGKTVGVVIGGHLHLSDGVVKVVGNNTITVDLTNLNLIDRWKRSYKAFTGNDLPDTTSASNWSNSDYLKEYLFSDFSFVVIFDNPIIGRVEHATQNTAKFGAYDVSANPVPTIIVDHLGKSMEYWDCNEDGNHVYITRESHSSTLAIKHTHWEREQWVGTHIFPADDAVRTMGRLIEFRSRI